MIGNKISKLIVAITSKDSGEVVERWQFDVQLLQSDQKLNSADTQGGEDSSRSQEEIQKDLQGIMRQITASVTFLPLLEDDCTFNVLVYADADASVPSEWADSDPKNIKNPEQVQLRSFSTDAHKIDTLVAYSLG